MNYFNQQIFLMIKKIDYLILYHEKKEIYNKKITELKSIKLLLINLMNDNNFNRQAR